MLSVIYVRFQYFKSLQYHEVCLPFNYNFIDPDKNTLWTQNTTSNKHRCPGKQRETIRKTVAYSTIAHFTVLTPFSLLLLLLLFVHSFCKGVITIGELAIFSYVKGNITGLVWLVVCIEAFHDKSKG